MSGKSAHPRQLVLGAIAIAALAVTAWVQWVIALYNGTPSMPVGFYVRTVHTPARGSIVTVKARTVTDAYARSRSFTDIGDRFLKRVVASGGDRVCAVGDEVTLNEAPLAIRQNHDSAGRTLPTWDGCYTLTSNEVFLLGDSPDSFNGRYWGPTPISASEGVWRPLLHNHRP